MKASETSTNRTIRHLHGLAAISAIISHVGALVVEPGPLLALVREPDAFIVGLVLWSVLAIHYLQHLILVVINWGRRPALFSHAFYRKPRSDTMPTNFRFVGTSQRRVHNRRWNR
jgi:hypothetical protein